MCCVQSSILGEQQIPSWSAFNDVVNKNDALLSTIAMLQLLILWHTRQTHYGRGTWHKKLMK